MSTIQSVVPHRRESVSVRELLSGPVTLTPLTGDVGLDNRITDASLHRPQLALAGYTEFFTYYRVQLCGNTEFYYLKSLDEDDRMLAFGNLLKFDVPCIVVANGHELDPGMIAAAREAGIPILSTPFDTTRTIYLLGEYLDDQFAPQCTIHGSFVDIYGCGILIVGRSGIGKSEIALDLVERGHRLVADDIVTFTKKRGSVLMGTGTKLTEHMMEIRGLGVIVVRQMFGVRAIRFQKRLEIIVELEEYDAAREYNRTGLDESEINILDVDIATVKLPIFPGKNVTVISETIALNYLLKTYGYHAPKVLAERLTQQIARRRSGEAGDDQRHVNYFQGDTE
jgi:HPr kinase/phosphorylase